MNGFMRFITDPQNLGAIIRSAECAGAHGIIVTERRSALLSPAAVKASAGASANHDPSAGALPSPSSLTPSSKRSRTS